MPHLIKILGDSLINKIAAGEVVERPASVVKELVENAVDAEATEIFVDVEQAGKRLIRVTDNGGGMSGEDLRLAFQRHATSKVSSESDLEAIQTMGFRGEALSSIAGVSHVRATTALRASSSGACVEIEGGTIKSSGHASAPPGTSIEIRHLFYNTPARLKFLKSAATESAHIVSAVSRQAMAHPKLRFRLSHNKKVVLDLPPSRDMQERIRQIHGSEIADNLIAFSGGRDGVGVSGLIGRPAYTRADRTHQDFYVNRRFVKNPSLTHALYAAFGDMLMRGRHPVGFVSVEIDPRFVDVNVHPAKAEIRFRNQSQIHDLIRDVLREGLRSAGMPEHHASASDSRAERVTEAAAHYIDRQGPSGSIPEIPPKTPHSTIFSGRRKTTFTSRPIQPDFSSLQTSFTGYSPLDIPADEEMLIPVAQIHHSFIIAQSRDGMALVDQHAAHERVLFENLQDMYRAGNIHVQDLLIPEQVDLGPAESELLSEYLPEMQKLGLMVEHFGGSTFIIKAVPALIVGGDYKRLLIDILDEITVHGTSEKVEELRDTILSTMACHPAIKVNRSLASREMEALLHDLFSCRMPHTCPHGRPTVVRFSLDDIRKLFKRT